MKRKIIASLGVASLILLSAPVAAQAAIENVIDAPSAPILLDGSSATRSFTVGTTGEVESVEVSIDFSANDGGTCDLAIVDDGFSYPNELAISLTSPDSTSVILVADWVNSPLPPTYADEVEPVRVTVHFTDSASELVGTTAAGLPESGSFQPAQPLSAFQGLEAAGNWVLEVADSAQWDVKCYYGATLTLHTVGDDSTATPGSNDPTPPSKIETAAQ